jgi:hypothetical protein
MRQSCAVLNADRSLVRNARDESLSLCVQPNECALDAAIEGERLLGGTRFGGYRGRWQELKPTWLMPSSINSGPFCMAWLRIFSLNGDATLKVPAPKSPFSKILKRVHGLWGRDGICAAPRSDCRIFGRGSRREMRGIAGSDVAYRGHDRFSVPQLGYLGYQQLTQ